MTGAFSFFLGDSASVTSFFSWASLVVLDVVAAFVVDAVEAVVAAAVGAAAAAEAAGRVPSILTIWGALAFDGANQ